MKRKKGVTLKLSKMEELFMRAKQFTGCDLCHRKTRYIYFYDGVPLGETCGLHQIRGEKKMLKEKK